MLIFPLFLDILPVIKRIFILTGSSTRKLRQKGINLLAGRALTYHLHPLTAKEQENSWQISKSLHYGHLPARFSEHGPQKYLKDYPPARCYLFYGGSTPLYIDDITVLPIEQAIRNLKQLLRPS
jgi:predicted AAA+ superfamily ATPase